MHKDLLLNNVVNNLKKIYRLAMKLEDYNLALQSQKIIAAILVKNFNNSDDPTLESLSTGQVKKLIHELESKSSVK